MLNEIEHSLRALETVPQKAAYDKEIVRLKSLKMTLSRLNMDDVTTVNTYPNV